MNWGYSFSRNCRKIKKNQRTIKPDRMFRFAERAEVDTNLITFAPSN